MHTSQLVNKTKIVYTSTMGINQINCYFFWLGVCAFYMNPYTEFSAALRNMLQLILMRAILFHLSQFCNI